MINIIPPTREYLLEYFLDNKYVKSDPRVITKIGTEFDMICGLISS